MDEKHYITWWNLENLFDVKSSPRRPSWLKDKLAPELQHWTGPLLFRKISNLASIMRQMNNNTGSDVYGVCEVENQHVLQRLADRLNRLLPNRNYETVLHNSDDKRGIDIGVIYDANKYSIRQMNGENKVFSYRITKRSPTRDILQVELITKKGNDLVLLMNHWYSRISGKYETEPYRIISAETMSYWVMRIQQELGVHMPILVMGDFNDEPYDRSMTKYALSTASKQRVMRGKNPYLYNLMWELAGQRQGTHVFGSEATILDQFLAAKGLLSSQSKIGLSSESAKVEIFDGMVSGSYNTPIRFRESLSKYNVNGFSDHLPISVELVER